MTANRPTLNGFSKLSESMAMIRQFKGSDK
jgi:hypothetical protein